MVLSSACMSVAIMAQTVTIVRLGDEAALLGVVMIAMADSPQLGERPVVSRIYSDIGAHAGTQGGIAIPARNSDANRNSLHDLDPVATGVLRRKNGELGPAGGRNRLDLPAPRLSWIGIDADLDVFA